jgi:capsular polysaccharide biosynthesis protein
VLAGIAVGIACGVVAVAAIGRTYTSTAVVLITPTGVETTTDSVTGRTHGDINVDTEAQLVKSLVVSEKARRLLGTHRSSVRLLRRVSVSVPANTTVLRISYRAASRGRAAAGAEAFARAYLANRAASATSVLHRQAAAVTREIRAHTTQSPRRQPLRVRNALLATLQKRLASIATTVVTPGQVIGAAQVQGARAEPHPVLLLLSAAMLGLLLGIGASVGRDWTDRRVRSTAKLGELGIPILASLPRRHEDAAAAYLRLGNAILMVSDGAARAVVVADVSPGQSDVGVANLLADALAASGRSVSVARVEAGAGYPHAEPLREEEAERAPMAAPRGDQALLEDERAGGARVRVEEVLEEVRPSPDIVLVEAGALAVTPLTPAVARSCDGVVLVVEVDRTRVPDLVGVVEHAELMGTRILGAAVHHA